MSMISDAITATARDVAESVEPLDIPLDGSEASLTDLDEVIALIWGKGGPSEEDFDGMVWGYGCYVADVIQRHQAGEWQRAEDAGYDFIPVNGGSGFNPWHCVEMRFRSGDLIAPQYKSFAQALAAPAASVAAATATSAGATRIAIHSRGLSFASQTIDQESFVLLSEAGLNEIEYEALIDEVQDEGDWIVGAFVGELEVRINEEVFTSSLEKVERQLNHSLPAPHKLYEHLGHGEYLLVYEELFQGTWQENEVAGYSHAQLKFEVECVEPSAGLKYVLLDFSYAGAALRDAAAESVGNDAYLVDRHGNRYEIKRTYEW